jgi:hypothetical protein
MRYEGTADDLKNRPGVLHSAYLSGAAVAEPAGDA